MKSAREILIERLHGLMRAKGWRRPNGEWDISALHGKAGGSRRWLYKLIRGESNFGIDEYERVLQKGFGLSFEAVVSGLSTSTVPREVEDLYARLTEAITHVQQTGTLGELRYAVHALADKAAADKALHEKTRAQGSRGPNAAPPLRTKRKITLVDEDELPAVSSKRTDAEDRS